MRGSRKTVVLVISAACLALIAGALLLVTFSGPGPAKPQRPGGLSEKAGALFGSFSAELTSFGLGIGAPHSPREGIGFTRMPIPGHGFENLVDVDSAQAARILEYLAKSGLLDKAVLGLPQGAQTWSAVAHSQSVSVHWQLGSEPDAPLHAKEFMGLRGVLRGRALEAWDRFVERMKQASAMLPRDEAIGLARKYIQADTVLSGNDWLADEPFFVGTWQGYVRHCFDEVQTVPTGFSGDLSRLTVVAYRMPRQPRGGRWEDFFLIDPGTKEVKHIRRSMDK